MRREHERHPFFEVLVFGLALLLIGVLLYYGGRALFGGRAKSGKGLAPGPDFTAGLQNPADELPHELDVGPTERGVNKLPPVAVSRVAKPSRKTADVPAPR